MLRIQYTTVTVIDTPWHISIWTYINVQGLTNFCLLEVQILKEGKIEKLDQTVHLCFDLICKRHFYSYDTIQVSCRKLIPENPTESL